MILFKFLTAHDDRMKDLQNEALKKHFNSPVDTSVTSRLEYAIHSIAGITDKNKK